MSHRRAVRLLQAAALALLLVGSVYGAVASETRQRTDQWAGPQPGTVVSGNCHRRYRVFPSLEPRPPDFIRFRGTTYRRGAEEARTPNNLRPTGYTHRGWRLLRAGRRFYLQPVGEAGALLPYLPRECP